MKYMVPGSGCSLHVAGNNTDHRLPLTGHSPISRKRYLIYQSSIAASSRWIHIFATNVLLFLKLCGYILPILRANVVFQAVLNQHQLISKWNAFHTSFYPMLPLSGLQSTGKNVWSDRSGNISPQPENLCWGWKSPLKLLLQVCKPQDHESFLHMSYRLPITDHRLPLTVYRLPITDYRSLPPPPTPSPRTHAPPPPFYRYCRLTATTVNG